MLEQARGSEGSRADAAALIGIDCRYGSVKGGKGSRPGFAINLMLSQGKQTSHAHAGIILERELLRLGASQFHRAGRRLNCWPGFLVWVGNLMRLRSEEHT